MASRIKEVELNRKPVEEVELAEEESSEIERVATMDPKVLVFKIVGISPLLQNNPENFIGVDQTASLSAGKKKYNDEDEAKLRLYADEEEGTFGHPAQAFVKAMVRAVAGRKFGKNFATTMIKGCVFICEPRVIILDERGNPATKYTIDRQPVVVGKARVLRCRPSWKKWRVNLPLEVDTALLHEKDVRDALSLAGRIVGIGDYRPEKGGGFGRFRVE